MGIGLSIAGGFGNRLSEYMRDKEKFDWENKRAERKFGMTTGQLGVAKAEEKAGIAVDKVKYLKSRGLTSLNLRYAFDKQSVGGIDMLYNEVLEGSEKATPEQLNRLMTVSKDFAAVDNRPWEEVFKEAYQIYSTPEKDRLATNEQKEKKGFWASMLADPSTTSGYDDGQRYGGYTRADQDRIIMASTTTPRGSGILKLNTEARVNALDPRDYKSYEVLAKTSFLNKQKLLEKSFANLEGDVTLSDGTTTLKSVAAQSQYNAWLEAGDWDSITDTYGDSLLSSYLEQEKLEIGSITNNMAVDENLRGWVSRKVNEPPFDPIEASNTSVAVTGGTTEPIDFAAEFEKAKVNFTKGTDLTAPRFNSPAEVREAIAAKTIKPTDAYFVYIPKVGWEAQAMIDIANFSPEDVQDGDFIAWAKSLPEKRSEASEDYKGNLQGPFKKSSNKGWYIEKIKERTKVVTSKLGVKYTYDTYFKLPSLSWTNARAKELGLPFKWKNAERDGFTVTYDLSGDK